MDEVECPECNESFGVDGFYKHYPQVHEGQAPVVHWEYMHRDKELLEWMYHEKGMSTFDIADRLGKSQDTIQVWMDRLDCGAHHGKSVKRRFDNRYEIDEETGCWEWTGYVKEQTGYGEMSVNAESEGAHRISYRLHNGEIPEGSWVLHKCHNPPCVNPDHLYAGDVRDNVKDAIEEGSFHHDGQMKRGEENRHAKLTEDDVRNIRSQYESSGKTMSDLAENHGTSLTNIFHIVHRNTWQHV